MTRHEFMLKLNRDVTDEEIEALYEVGCGDAAVETGPLGTLLDFSREAHSLAEALVSAARDIEKVKGLRAVGVACENVVSLAEIADKVGVTREAVRLWSTGQRGPGGFPLPVILTSGGEHAWDWQQVAAWVQDYRDPQPNFIWPMAMRMRVLCTADRVLAARDALLSEPDDDVRGELERLLEDA